MSALDRLAERMFGRQRLETTAAMASVDTQTYIGVATSDSADGSVSVVLSDDVTQPDNGIWDGDTFLASDELGTSVELPTTTAVREGDRVLVTASGANVMATPVVTGVVGRGDEQQAQIDAAAEAAASVEGIAQEALDVANATGQHFWSDTDGIHVTEVTEEEWSDSTGSDYHSGGNVLINALGQLFRDGLNNILAIVSGTDPGIAIYDGQGNADGNITASFTDTLVRIGRNSANAVIDFCAGGVRMTYDSVRVGFTILSSMRIYLLSEGNSTTNATLEATSTNETTSVSRTASINAHASTGASSQQIMLEVYEGDGSTEYQSVSLQSAGFRINGGTPAKGVFFGTTIVNVGTTAVSTFVLFTKAQLQAIVGTGWTPTVSNCAVFVMNGDYGVTDAMMTSSIASTSVVRVHMNKTRTGNVRVNYLIIRFA